MPASKAPCCFIKSSRSEQLFTQLLPGSAAPEFTNSLVCCCSGELLSAPSTSWDLHRSLFLLLLLLLRLLDAGAVFFVGM